MVQFLVQCSGWRGRTVLRGATAMQGRASVRGGRASMRGASAMQVSIDMQAAGATLHCKKAVGFFVLSRNISIMTT